MKSEEEVEEERDENEDQEEIDPDAQPMERYEEDFIANSNVEGQRGLVSGNEEDHSEDDSQMRNRYQDEDDRRPEFVRRQMDPEDEIPRDNEDSDEEGGNGSENLGYLQQVDDDGEQSPIVDNE